MSELTDEQRGIVYAPLGSMSVVACAGSGKTKTAVQRLIKIREELGQSRCHVALLSFSNVAVDTFKKAYSKTSSELNGAVDSRVTIDTFDGFIASHILRPHAHRTMGCKVAPFLISGSEPFLNNKMYTYYSDLPNGDPCPVLSNRLNDVVVGFNAKDDLAFYYRQFDNLYPINNGRVITERLGKVGAYTYELGKFWSLLTLVEQPEILRVMATRYPYILIDEAQDIGVLHQIIIEKLIEQGVKVSLIGDPSQAIYEFAGATGQFIRSFDAEPTNTSHSLSLNFRSIPNILSVANAMSGRDDEACRRQSNDLHGAYYALYDPSNHRAMVDTFVNRLEESGLSPENSAVLYRSRPGMEKLHGVSKKRGRGRILLLANAAYERDANANYRKAFQLVTNCILGLLENTPNNLASMLMQPDRIPDVRSLRLDIWKFTRSIDKGLPSAYLKAKSEWHELTKERFIALLENIQKKYGYGVVDKLGNKLAKTELEDTPLISGPELIPKGQLNIRVDTVHQAKGESLDAVLYMATTKSHTEHLLAGVETEVGRIGYVAMTRAKNLFVLGVPKANAQDLSPKMEKMGLKKW